MKINYGIYLIVIFALLLSSCKKEEGGCLGCGIDYTPYDAEFKLSGLLSTCNNNSIPLRELKVYKNNHSGMYNLIDSIQTDENGYFDYRYVQTVSYGYCWGLACNPPLMIRSVEDSTIFLVPYLLSQTNLEFTVNDSIDMDVIINFENASEVPDTLLYQFHRADLDYYEDYLTEPTYKVGGPFVDGEIIGHIKKRWNIIEFSDNGTRFQKCYRRGYYTNNTSTHANHGTSKIPCVERRDSVIIDF